MQFKGMHTYLEHAIEDCSPAVLTHRLPGATINSVGAIYAHTIFGEDGLLNGLVRGATPVYFAEGWAPKIGVEMPAGSMEPAWHVDYDLQSFREYADGVYRATDNYLATLTDQDLERMVDAGFMPPVPLSQFLSDVLLWHVATHQGEISALKGAQGLNGLARTH
jgi:hypothetical protein